MEMSSKKYGSFDFLQQVFRQQAQKKIETTLLLFNKELESYKSFFDVKRLKGKEIEFNNMGEKILSEIQSGVINGASFPGHYNNFNNKFNEIQNLMRDEIHNQCVNLIKDYQKEIDLASKGVEPEALQNLSRQLNSSSDTLFRECDSKSIKEIGELINKIDSSLSQALDKAKKEWSELKVQLHRLEDNENVLFQQISDKNSQEISSKSIKLVEKELFKKAKDIHSKEISKTSLKKALEYEQRRIGLLTDLNQKIGNLINRDGIVKEIKVVDKVPGFNDFMSLLDSEEQKEKPSVEKDSVVNNILSFKSEIMKSDFVEYHGKTDALTKDLSEKSDKQLSMIKWQLNLYLSEIIKLTEKSKIIRRQLHPLKLSIAQSKLPEAREMTQTIEDLFRQSIISEKELIEVSKKIEAIKEKEEKMEEISTKSELIKKMSTVFTEELKKLGYSPHREVELDSEPIYVDIPNEPNEPYKLKIVGNQQGNILFKFIRIVASEEEKEAITDWQREEDIKRCQKWASDYHEFVNRLSEREIILNEEWRNLPESVNIEIEVNADLLKSRKKRSRRQEFKDLKEKKFF